MKLSIKTSYDDDAAM